MEIMKLIGKTEAGSVIVEMTDQEFEALRYSHHTAGNVRKNAKQPSGANQMSPAEKVDFVTKRLRKLGPRKFEAVVHSIESMFQFTGGIDRSEIDGIISKLKKQKVFSIDAKGNVTYTIPANT